MMEYRYGIERSFATPDVIADKMLSPRLRTQNMTKKGGVTRLSLNTLWHMLDPWFVELVLGKKGQNGECTTYELSNMAVTFLTEIRNENDTDYFRGCAVTRLGIQSKVNTPLSCSMEWSCGIHECGDAHSGLGISENQPPYVFNEGVVEDSMNNIVTRVSGFRVIIRTGQKQHYGMGSANSQSVTAGSISYKGMMEVDNIGAIFKKMDKHDDDATLRLTFIRNKEDVVEFIFKGLTFGIRNSSAEFMARKFTAKASK